MGNKCLLCDIGTTCKTNKLMGYGKKSSKIMFVVDQLSTEEDNAGRLFIGNSGKMFLSALEDVGISKQDCYFTTAVKCNTPTDRTPTRQEIENCRQYLEAEIDVIKPSIIVPMGNVSLKLLMNKTGITKFRGKATEIEDVLYFPILHPDNVFRQPVYMDNFVKDLKNLQKLSIEGKNFLSKKNVEYHYLETVDEIFDEIGRLMESEWVVFDLETTGLNPYKKDSKIVCIALSDRTHYGVTIPLQHKDFAWNNKDYKRVVTAIKMLMENENVKKIAHNGKFDMKWLLAIYGIDVKSFAFDPMLAHYLTISEERGGHGLKELAWENTDMGGYDNPLDTYKNKLPEHAQHNYDNIPWTILREYASADVDCTFRLFEKFYDLVYENESWTKIYDDILIEGSYALRDIEHNGILLSPKKLETYENVYPKRMNDIIDKLREYPEVVKIEREKLKLFELRQIEMKKPKIERNEEILKYGKFKDFKFNFGSTAQLRELLFEKLGLQTPYLTEKADLKKSSDRNWKPGTQDFSTGKETLQYLENKHPIVKMLSEYRKLEKIYGTYVSPAREWVDVDGLVHPSFNLHGTVTGRLSSESPNAQNFPRKSNDPNSFQYKYGVKKLFESRFGEEGVILQFDYSQLELRVATIFSKDKKLIQAYDEGKDLHTYVAAKVFNISEDEVTKDMRTSAKAVNFGILYGKGAHSLSQEMGLSLEEAEDFISRYFDEFSGIKKWLDETRRFVTKHKYVKSLTGRYRRLFGVDSNDRAVQGDSFRQAINSPIQSSGSDMTMTAVILINKELKRRNLKSCLAITVHDSIVADVHQTELEEVYQIMKDTMENLPFEWITVPIVADCEVGKDYGTLVEFNIDEYKSSQKSIFEYIDYKSEAEEKSLLSK